MGRGTPLIVVVDDEPHIVQVLKLRLEIDGYEVLGAEDGEEALALVQEHRPDLLITDYQMPYMSGVELCRAIRDDAETHAMPILMLTARQHSIHDRDLGACAIDHILAKPFSPREISEYVARLLARGDWREVRKTA
jgi:two-component system phosphate regulon response regulator PhoB